MAWECPRGFETYRNLLFRFSDVRGAGGGKWARFRCLFPERHKHQDQNWSGLMWIGTRGELVCRCLGCGANWAEFVRETGTTSQDWWPRQSRWSRDHERGRVMPVPIHVATYKYRDAEGRLAFEKLRWEPGKSGKDKSFEFRRPLPRHLKKQAGIPELVEPCWVWGITAGEYGRPNKEGVGDLYPVNDTHAVSVTIDAATPLLYRLPEVIRARPDVPVLVVEGEADVDLLTRLGFVATCGHAGSSTWLPHWSEHLRGKRVVVIPDNDPVGMKHAELAAGSILRREPASLRVVEWQEVEHFDPGPGGGVGNWLARLPGVGDGEGATAAARQRIIDLCKLTHEYKKAS